MTLCTCGRVVSRARAAEHTVNEMIIQTYTSGSSVALLGVPQTPFVSTAIFMVMVPKLLGVDTPVCHVSTKNLSSFVSRRDAVVSLGEQSME